MQVLSLLSQLPLKAPWQEALSSPVGRRAGLPGHMGVVGAVGGHPAASPTFSSLPSSASARSPWRSLAFHFSIGIAGRAEGLN